MAKTTLNTVTIEAREVEPGDILYREDVVGQLIEMRVETVITRTAKKDEGPGTYTVVTLLGVSGTYDINRSVAYDATDEVEVGRAS